MEMKLEYNNGTEVLSFNDDDSIYHFTQKETAIEHILNNKSLRFGDFKSTNDPYEYKAKMISSTSYGFDKNDRHIALGIRKEIGQLIASCGFFTS